MLKRLTALSLFMAATLAAQTGGRLAGTVSDRSGAVMTDVKLTATHAETGLSRITYTGSDGNYAFADLPPAEYKLRAERTGFRTVVQEGLPINVATPLTVNLTLEVGAIDQALTVQDKPSMVNTQTSELSYLVGERAMRELPLNGRNYTDLALLTPGVIPFPHRDGGSVVAHGLAISMNGQDPRSNTYLLDGTPQNDFTNGPSGSAASTALGLESIREFRVELNTYSAEYGRNSGGHINALTKSGGNGLHGSVYYFHRNDNFDARNFFDGAKQPDFKRNQFGTSLGGPIRREKTFFFGAWEALHERLGRTISTVVPDENARRGVLPDGPVAISPAVAPYLNEYPLPNGPNRGGGLATYAFGFNQKLDQNFAQGRVDHYWTGSHQSFARYTFDDAEQYLPTDYPQFPRFFRSRNMFLTMEHRWIASPRTSHTFRGSFARTRIGQNVEANTATPLEPFIPGRGLVGNIDIGGFPRWGPQTSVGVKLVQNLFGMDYSFAHHRGRHLIKGGAMAEHYQDNMVNPTFSLGIHTFASLRTFLQNQPQRFLGLPAGGAIDRYWRFTLMGFFLQDDWRVNSRLTLNAGLRYEFSTMPVDIYGRDSALINLATDKAPTVGPLYQNPTYKNISPRIGFAWNVTGDGRTALRGGYGLFFNTNNQQHLIVTVTNPPATPRVIVNNAAFPVPNLSGGVANSMRPIQWNIESPRIQVYNVTFERQLPFDILVSAGYAGSRGTKLWRSGDWNTATPTVLNDGTLFFPAGAPRKNTAFGVIELKSSDGDSWYNAGLLEVRKRLSAGLTFQTAYTFSRNIDTTQASTFFSDATNGTTTAFPEFSGFRYNKGLADYHAKHNWVTNFVWQMPFASGAAGVTRALLHGWQLAGILTVRSGSPLTVFVQQNRSRSLAQPSLGPGIGFDRPSMAPGYTYESAILGRPDQWFNPAAFVLQPAGQLGNVGRGALIGPNLRSFDLSLMKNFALPRIGEAGNLQFRLETFNLANRANFGPPGLTAFAGTAATETPLASFGLVRSTVTSARQIQLGLRLSF